MGGIPWTGGDEQRFGVIRMCPASLDRGLSSGYLSCLRGTFFPSGRFTVEAEGMKVRLDAGDVVFLHKKAQVSNIDLKHSSR